MLMRSKFKRPQFTPPFGAALPVLIAHSALITREMVRRSQGISFKN
jgi:hypothetical protein